MESLIPHRKERIIFCIDLNQEMENTVLKGKIEGPRIEWLKTLLCRFFQMKNFIDPRHEFAIICLTDVAVWYMDFTNDYPKFMKFVRDLTTIQENWPSFDVESLFKLLEERNLKPTGSDHLLRIIFIYGRSSVIPSVNKSELVKSYLQDPNFAFDALYLHEKSSPENKIQQVYNEIVSMELEEQNFYFYETSKSSKRLTSAMFQLLAQPGQRPMQSIDPYFYGEQ